MKQKNQKDKVAKASGQVEGNTSIEPISSLIPKAVPKKNKRKKNSSQVISNYQKYIHAVNKQVNPSNTISKQGMSIMNSFVNDLAGKLAFETQRTMGYSKKITMHAKDLQTSVRLIIPGELSKHGISEATKAVTCFLTTSA
eukprot:gene10354-13909_t